MTPRVEATARPRGSAQDAWRSATAPRDQLAARGEAFAHAYISNGPSGVPQKASGLRRAWAKLERLCSTHPSTDDRIAALRRADALARKK